ncbi:MAG: hypothetical protein ACJAZJ_001207 [Candidatus Endobugula sp.]
MIENDMTEVITNTSFNVLIETASRWLALTEVQLACAALLFVSVCVLILISRKKSAKIKKDLDKLQKDLFIANSITIGMGQKLIDIEKQLRFQEQASKLSKKNKDSYNQSASQSIGQSNEQSSKSEIVGETPTVSNEQYRNDITSNDRYKNPDKAMNSTVNSALNSTVNRLTNLSLVNNDIVPNDELPDDKAYEKTRQLLSQGVDIPEVVKQSGLSFSEVSLMQKLVR